MSPTADVSSSSQRRVGLLAGDGKRENDVLLRRQHRQQVEELEDEADVLAPKLRQLRVVELADLGIGDPDVTVGRLIEAGEDVHERRLAGPRGAHHCGQLAASNLDRDTPQGVHGGLALAVLAGEVVGGHDGCGGRVIARLGVDLDSCHCN